MSEHEFVTTYRGVEVPPWVLRMSDEDFATAFRQGVDGVLDAKPTSTILVGESVPCSFRESDFVGRVFLDDSGDEWHEQSPDAFDCSWDDWCHSGDLVGVNEIELRRRYPNLAQVDKPATRRPH